MAFMAKGNVSRVIKEKTGIAPKDQATYNPNISGYVKERVNDSRFFFPDSDRKSLLTGDFISFRIREFIQQAASLTPEIRRDSARSGLGIE